MLKIYGIYRSRASRTLWLAGELGIPFEHVPVIQASRLANPDAVDARFHTRSAEFLKINPSGRIPVIVDDGLVLCESLAINLYLARKHGGPLAPADVREEGQAAMWSLWAATAAEANALNVLYHMAAKPPAERDSRLAAESVAALRAPFAVLDGALAPTGYLMGGRFTVADLNVAEVIRYAMPARELFEANPNVARWLAACHARPAFKEMMAKRDAEPA